MENKVDIFSRRLRQARVKARLSLEALSERMNGAVTKQALSKYEAAKMMPNSTTLIALATALGMNMEYFFRPFAYGVGPLNVSFRKKSSVGAKDVAALKVQIQDEVERRLEIEEILGIDATPQLTTSKNNICTREDMERLAQSLREQWRLGQACIANVKDVLEMHGVKVICTEAADGFDGLSGVVNGKHCIIVLNSTNRHVERRRLTALHELAHLLCNESFADGLTPRQRENLCNDFASEMLLPGEVLVRAFEGKRNIALSELVSVSESYGISVDAIAYKLHAMGIVSDSRYRGFCIYKSKSKSFKAMVEQSRYFEKDTGYFEAMVFNALSQQLITVTKAATLLGCPVSKITNTINIL